MKNKECEDSCTAEMQLGGRGRELRELASACRGPCLYSEGRPLEGFEKGIELGESWPS